MKLSYMANQSLSSCGLFLTYGVIPFNQVNKSPESMPYFTNSTKKKFGIMLGMSASQGILEIASSNAVCSLQVIMSLPWEYDTIRLRDGLQSILKEIGLWLY